MTPLIPLPGLAKAHNISRLWYKDEGERFGIGSFKALGGGYALLKVLQTNIAGMTGILPSSEQLRSGEFQHLTEKITVATATDGNHGRALAWAANLFHCPCVVYVPNTCTRNRERAIAQFGANVIRSSSGYDATVRECAVDAHKFGWTVVSDTSWHGFEQVAAWVMQGYTVLSSEIIEQLDEDALPTHAFVQAGVGGLAASVCALFTYAWGPDRPMLVVAEPESAACLFASAEAGRPTPAKGVVRTIMAGLECGEVSTAAWKVLVQGADFFMTVSDSAAPACMRLLASSPFGDTPVIAGESAVAGLAGVLHLLGNEEACRKVRLDANSKVLVIGTESDTDADVYYSLTGVASADVRARRDEI